MAGLCLPSDSKHYSCFVGTYYDEGVLGHDQALRITSVYLNSRPLCPLYKQHQWFVTD